MMMIFPFSRLLSLLFLCTLPFFFFSCNQNGKSPLAESLPEFTDIEHVECPPIYEYGLRVDSFTLFRGQIAKNEFLSDILLRYNVDYPTIHKLTQNCQPLFDVRRIKAGNPYCMVYGFDSIIRPRYFVYEINPVDYIIFDFEDSLKVWKEQKEVHYQTKMASGVIRSSLYETLQQSGHSPVLAYSLSEVYAWTIDFYKLQKGDKYKVIYEERYIEGKRAGVSRILAASFTHYSTEHMAFYFEQDSMPDYFDENAKSLRKQFLQAPVKYSRISSGYSQNRLHPVQKVNKPHLGTDYAAPHGTPIMATGNGIVTEARYTSNNGNYVKIRHNSVYSTQYLHMSKFAPGIKSGTRVTQGQVIGFVGSTGLATGPHVCYRFWKNGHQVDHRKEKFPPSLPVKPEYMEAFKAYMDEMKSRLDSIPYPEETTPAIAIITQ